MSAAPTTGRAAGLLQLVAEHGEACSEYTHLCERGGPPRIVDQARAARDRTLDALRGAILDAAGDPVGDTVRAEPTTARGKAIIEAAREMADAQERAAVSYEHGSALGRAQGDSDAADARAELDRLVADWENALSAAEERARKAEAERDEWRGVAEEGADAVLAARYVAAASWAVAVRNGIDPAAGTGDHDAEPGGMGTDERTWG